MANWSDTIILINEIEPLETDNNGFYSKQTETKREVFANKKSVTYSEFFQAAQAGQSAAIKIEIRNIEYNGESIVEYENKRYTVIRSYASRNGDKIELTLTDIKSPV